MKKWLWLRSKMRQTRKSKQFSKRSSRIPAWAVFFWLAQLRRWLRITWRDFVATLFLVTTRNVFKVENRNLEHFSYDSSSIIVFNHKRDLDIPLIVAELYVFKKPRRRRALRMMYCATRDDMHENGFISLYFPALDKRFRPLLARLRVGRIVKQLQSCPVKLPDEQTVSQLLQETKRIEGNLLLTEAVTAEWRAKLVGPEKVNQADLTLWDAILQAPLETLRQYATPRMFREPLATKIIKRHHQTVVSQLRHMSRVLDKGGTLMIAPEGQVTPDGHFGKMRAALTRVVQQTRANSKMLPLNITYDFMDTDRRPLATLIAGPEIIAIKNYGKSELPEVVRKHILALGCVTLSGLASRWLVEAASAGRQSIGYRELEAELWEETQRLKAAGLSLDKRLENWQDFEARLARFVAYAVTKGQIFSNTFDPQTLYAGTRLELDIPALLREDCYSPNDNPVRYCYNELIDLLEAHNLLEVAPAEAAPVILNLGEERARRRTAG